MLGSMRNSSSDFRCRAASFGGRGLLLFFFFLFWRADAYGRGDPRRPRFELARSIRIRVLPWRGPVFVELDLVRGVDDEIRGRARCVCAYATSHSRLAGSRGGNRRGAGAWHSRSCGLALAASPGPTGLYAAGTGDARACCTPALPARLFICQRSQAAPCAPIPTASEVTLRSPPELSLCMWYRYSTHHTILCSTRKTFASV